MLLTKNTKTVVSLDFDRLTTCLHHCKYCYVNQMEKLYPNYLKKVKKNSILAKNPVIFSQTLNEEYKKQKVKVPSVRLYGGGDYIPRHFNFINKLDFPFFIISKNLTTKYMRKDVGKLVRLSNSTSIILSLDAQIMDRYKKVSRLRRDNRNKVKLAFTGTPDQFEEVNQKGRKFDIFFNIKKDKINRQRSQTYKESCPCDSGQLEHHHSCLKCNKCYI